MYERIKSFLASTSRGHVVFLAILGFGLFAAVLEARRHETNARSPVEARFAALGRANASRVIASHAFAYEAAAKAVRAKVPMAKVVAAIPADSAAILAASGERDLVPELAKVLPPGTPDADITEIQRSNLADAFDGYARGLRGKYP